jgi:hypothetical protein
MINWKQCCWGLFLEVWGEYHLDLSETPAAKRKEVGVSGGAKRVRTGAHSSLISAWHLELDFFSFPASALAFTFVFKNHRSVK